MSERLRPDWTRDIENNNTRAAILAERAARRVRVQLAKISNSTSPTITGVDPNKPTYKSIIPDHRRK